MIRRLPREPYIKPDWGAPATAPWYENSSSERIGEIWFRGSEDAALLVKLLFTSDNLSVQVHPDDAAAREANGSRGKTEMWHVVSAAEGARIALGLKRRVSRDELRAAAQVPAAKPEDSPIVGLLNWIPVQRGDTFFVPARTIHAIGGGLVICEVQQNCDITYRLFDWGRGRELHLEDALRVSCLEGHDAGPCPLPVACDYFHTDRFEVHGQRTVQPSPHQSIFIALEGEGTIGAEPFRAGEAFEVSGGSGAFEIASPHAVFLFTEERSPAI